MKKRHIFILLLLLLFIISMIVFLHDETQMVEVPLIDKMIQPDERLKTDLIQMIPDLESIEDLSVSRIVDNQVLKDRKLTLYHVNLDYKWMEGLLIYEDDRLKGFMSFMHLEKLFLIESKVTSGLLGYGTYGSGLLYNDIGFLDLATNRVHHKSYFNDMKALDFKWVDGKIMVYTYDVNMERTSIDPVGELEIDKGIRIIGLEPVLLEVE